MKTVYEILERIFAVFLSVSACLGMFLVGCLAGNLFCGALSFGAMWAIFLGCVITTWVAIQLLLEVRYRRLLCEVEEQEIREAEENSELYRHLTQNL